MDTLDITVVRGGALDERAAVGWIIRLAKALERLHSRGVVHGNVTAEAVEIAGPKPTSRGALIASTRLRPLAPYHSPERVAGGPVSPESDTWAVAVTLHYALTGALPFPGESDLEVRKRISGPRPSSLADSNVMDRGLQRILAQAFHRDVARRLSRIRSLREALEAWHPDPAAKQLPPLDEDARSAAGTEAAQSVARSDNDGERLTPVVPIDPASSFAVPTVDDDDEKTVVRPEPVSFQQHRALFGPRFAGGIGPARPPQVTPPPPASSAPSKTVSAPPGVPPLRRAALPPGDAGAPFPTAPLTDDDPTPVSIEFGLFESEPISTDEIEPAPASVNEPAPDRAKAPVSAPSHAVAPASGRAKTPVSARSHAVAPASGRAKAPASARSHATRARPAAAPVKATKGRPAMNVPPPGESPRAKGRIWTSFLAVLVIAIGLTTIHRPPSALGAGSMALAEPRGASATAPSAVPSATATSATATSAVPSATATAGTGVVNNAAPGAAASATASPTTSAAAASPCGQPWPAGDLRILTPGSRQLLHRKCHELPLQPAGVAVE
jgi:hypothetical protein